MKRSSKEDDDETTHDDGIVQAEPIIVDHPPKPDPKLLGTVLKVNYFKIYNSFIIRFFLISINRLLVQNQN